MSVLPKNCPLSERPVVTVCFLLRVSGACPTYNRLSSLSTRPMYSTAASGGGEYSSPDGSRRSRNLSPCTSSNSRKMTPSLVGIVGGLATFHDEPPSSLYSKLIVTCSDPKLCP